MAKGKTGGKTPAHGKDVIVQPRGDDWEVKKQGNERASAVTDTKKEAMEIGRKAAQKEHSELIIKDQRGRIQSKDSHGHDPKKTKG